MVGGWRGGRFTDRRTRKRVHRELREKIYRRTYFLAPMHPSLFSVEYSVSQVLSVLLRSHERQYFDTNLRLRTTVLQVQIFKNFVLSEDR